MCGHYKSQKMRDRRSVRVTKKIEARAGKRVCGGVVNGRENGREKRRQKAPLSTPCRRNVARKPIKAFIQALTTCSAVDW